MYMNFPKSATHICNIASQHFFPDMVSTRRSRLQPNTQRHLQTTVIGGKLEVSTGRSSLHRTRERCRRKPRLSTWRGAHNFPVSALPLLGPTRGQRRKCSRRGDKKRFDYWWPIRLHTGEDNDFFGGRFADIGWSPQFAQE